MNYVTYLGVENFQTSKVGSKEQRQPVFHYDYMIIFYNNTWSKITLITVDLFKLPELPHILFIL